MLSPILEKLILQGKAMFRTAVVGGSEKFILNVQNDRFIIITDINFQMPVKSGKDFFLDATGLKLLLIKGNTQMKVFSTKSNNTFLFRPTFNVSTVEGKYLLTPGASTSINTYLVHESDVSFTFSNAGFLNPTELRVLTDPQSIGYPPPMDYGKAGTPGSLAVTEIASVVASDSGRNFIVPGGDLYTQQTVGASAPTEVIFPVDNTNRYNTLESPFDYPIVNISYVEIQGSPNNISGTY